MFTITPQIWNEHVIACEEKTDFSRGTRFSLQIESLAISFRLWIFQAFFLSRLLCVCSSGNFISSKESFIYCLHALSLSTKFQLLCVWWKLIWCILLTLLTQKSSVSCSFLLFFPFIFLPINAKHPSNDEHARFSLAARRTQNFYTWIKINCISRQWTLASVTLLTIPIHREVAKERALKKVNTFPITNLFPPFLSLSLSRRTLLLISRYLFTQKHQEYRIYNLQFPPIKCEKLIRIYIFFSVRSLYYVFFD